MRVYPVCDCITFIGTENPLAITLVVTSRGQRTRGEERARVFINLQYSGNHLFKVWRLDVSRRQTLSVRTSGNTLSAGRERSDLHVLKCITVISIGNYLIASKYLKLMEGIHKLDECIKTG